MSRKKPLSAILIAFTIIVIIFDPLYLSARGKKGKDRIKPVGPDPKIVRTAVIGGMIMTGLWKEISKRFEAKTGYKVVVVAHGPRPVLDRAFREGKADLLTMHSGDITTDLVADGYGMNMRPWTRNDLVIMGPPSDPAKIRGLRSGVEAFKRIAAAQAPYLDAFNKGGRELSHTLWTKAGVRPRGSWVIKDEGNRAKDIITFADKNNAYVVFGRMPVLFEKIELGSMKIMVEGDPLMRRPYIVMEANPKRVPGANTKGAKMLADFLLSEEIQKFLSKFGTKEYGGMPLFYPVWPEGSEIPS
ncbi:MAG TPA: substrate-binding domain-containing protein [Spirochaetota bacterium]|nr:substrate-binding domain-containing protein [Spirochaetota bacterium]HRT76849.1 substrate-binding domain-containing protein [Spirochaetota bacterium]